MIGIIMAGGKGTRLFPLTENKPKPLVSLLGKPVIEYVKDALVNIGIDEIILTTGYKGEGLQKIVDIWNQNSDVVFSVNQESTPMGTAGSVKLLEERLLQTFIVASGDSVLSSDLGALVRAHKSSNAKVTMALWEVEDPTQFGIVGLSNMPNGNVDGNLDEGYITKFLEKPTLDQAFSNVINAGLYIIEPEVMSYVPKDTKFDFSKELFPHLLELGLPMYGVKLNGVWFDVGTPKELIRAQNHLVEHFESLPFGLPSGEYVDESSYLIGNSISNSQLCRTVVSKNSIIGHDSKLIDNLVMDGAKIGNNCSLIGTIIGENVIIDDNCELTDCVIGDAVHIVAGTKMHNEQVSRNASNSTQ
tara:strand:- start:454 stop:1530 length:1077 start_codon:yes stop_codon:yes gene_type:complete